MTIHRKRRILATSALPSASGAIHLGHLLTHIQSDIWVRFQRMMGNQCFHISADNTHGTAMMKRAEDDGITTEELIEKVRRDHVSDFEDFGIRHDNYYTTHATENRFYAEQVYNRILARGRILTKAVKQLYDPEREAFLTGRFIKGTCPKCKAVEQFGDSCESCGATYEAMDLIGPRSMISEATPVTKESDHYFFQLSKCSDFLKKWAGNRTLHDQLASKLAESLEAGLEDWDICRDAPYFGMEIPGESEKYFAAGLGTPVGYMASFDEFCDERRDLTFSDFWDRGSDTEVHHFVGKDNLDVHALFWPAILDSAGYRTPTAVHAHGFINLGGQKMSKSRGTLIHAGTYLKHLRPDDIRYYFATKLNGTDDDIDVSLTDFVALINSELVGKFANMPSRCAAFINTRCDGQLADAVGASELIDAMVQKGDVIVDLLQGTEFSKATREIMALADQANQFIDEHNWQEQGREKHMQSVCSDGINMFRLLVIYLKPIIPAVAARAEGFLNIQPLSFGDRHQLLTGHKINTFEPLLTTVQMSQMEAIVEGSRETGDP